jgi:hypothetical protein
VVFRIDRFYARLPLIEKKEVKQRPVGSFWNQQGESLKHSPALPMQLLSFLVPERDSHPSSKGKTSSICCMHNYRLSLPASFSKANITSYCGHSKTEYFGNISMKLADKWQLFLYHSRCEIII